MQSMSQHSSADAVMSSALTTLDVQTDVTRGIEATQIKSIIDPRLKRPTNSPKFSLKRNRRAGQLRKILHVP